MGAAGEQVGKGHAKSPWSCPTLCDPWTVADQAPLSMGCSRQEYWSALPCPPPGDLPNPGIKPTSFATPDLAGGFFTTSATWEGDGGTNREMRIDIDTSPYVK